MLTEDQGERIVIYAREVLESYIKNEELPEVPDEDFLGGERGVFVTLNKDDDLRGCVGVPLPDFPLGRAIKKAAQNAADDRRFPPIEERELDKINVEVTVLTEPEKIEVKKSQDYLDKIEVGKHGLIIKGKGRQGLLLPQVPEEQGWNCKEYLEGLCRKARLGPEAWKEDDTEINCFEGQIFKE